MIFCFTKMQALGNDFVLIDQREREVAISSDQIMQIADRRHGVGCDQVIMIYSHAEYDCSMRVYNQDGSPASACGNATRCVAELLQAHYSKILVGDRVLEAQYSSSDNMLVNMGKAIFDWEKIPLSKKVDTKKVHFDMLGFKLDGVTLSMGNPHIVFFTDDIDTIDLKLIAPGIENHELFPQKVNVSFARVINENNIHLRTWERGVGETPACGTAACAAFAAAKALNYITGLIKISFSGGSLYASEAADGSIMLRGSATKIYSGIWTL